MNETSDDGAVTLLRGGGHPFTRKGARTVSLKALGYATGKDADFGYVLSR